MLGGSVCASRERDCAMVGPLYRDPRPAAQLLISSAAHQSLVHDHRLAKSLGPHIAAAWIPLKGYLEAADGPRSEESAVESQKERERGRVRENEAEGARLFML